MPHTWHSAKRFTIHTFIYRQTSASGKTDVRKRPCVPVCLQSS